MADMVGPALKGGLIHSRPKVRLEIMEAETQGEIMIYGASGLPEALATSTDGYALHTRGVDADVSWAPILSTYHYFDATERSSISTSFATVATPPVFTRTGGLGESFVLVVAAAELGTTYVYPLGPTTVGQIIGPGGVVYWSGSQAHTLPHSDPPDTQWGASIFSSVLLALDLDQPDTTGTVVQVKRTVGNPGNCLIRNVTINFFELHMNPPDGV